MFERISKQKETFLLKFKNLNNSSFLEIASRIEESISVWGDRETT
jgi:hypothetical protein